MPANPSGMPLHPPTTAPLPPVVIPGSTRTVSAPMPSGGGAWDPALPAPAHGADPGLAHLRHMSAEVDGIAMRVRGGLALEQEKLRLEEHVTRLQRTLQHVNRALEEEEEGRRRDAEEREELRALLDDAAAAAEQHKRARDEALAEVRDYERRASEFADEKGTMNSHISRTGAQLAYAQDRADRLEKEGEVLRSWVDRGSETAAEADDLRRRCAQLDEQVRGMEPLRAVQDAFPQLRDGVAAAIPAMYDAARRANAAATALRSGTRQPLDAVTPAPPPPGITPADAERAGRQAQELAASVAAALATLDLAVGDTLHVQQRWQEGARSEQSHTMELRRIAERAQEELTRQLAREAEESAARAREKRRHDGESARLRAELDQWKERALLDCTPDLSVAELQRRLLAATDERDALRMQLHGRVSAANTSCPPTPTNAAGRLPWPGAAPRPGVDPSELRARLHDKGGADELWKAQAVAATLYREKAALQRLCAAQQQELNALRGP